LGDADPQEKEGVKIEEEHRGRRPPPFFCQWLTRLIYISLNSRTAAVSCRACYPWGRPDSAQADSEELKSAPRIFQPLAAG